MPLLCVFSWVGPFGSRLGNSEGFAGPYFGSCLSGVAAAPVAGAASQTAALPLPARAAGN